eukprot:TRINITY_DN2054_c0_g1_i1.p1 TRINITY_DN2054_c0_g1~~TRINITY_DN2054_c0_g1_i1.p1  ORF type:complete len:233 (+),score=68.95 TRINITY_DN2054_c0_g1_i1:30-728(+)
MAPMDPATSTAKPDPPTGLGATDEEEDVEDDTGWDLVENSNGLAVYEKNIEGCRIAAMRAHTVLPYPLSDVFGILHLPELKARWVDRMVRCDIVEQTLREGPVSTEVNYTQFELPWPLSSRDFVTEMFIKATPAARRIRMVARSCTHPKYPETEDFVRGFVHSATMVIEAVTASSTRITLDNCADIGGMIPSVVLNLLQRTWPVNTVEKIIAVAEERRWPSDPLFKVLLPDA